MSEAANRGKGGRPPEAGKVKDSGGLWTSFIEGFVGGLTNDHDRHRSSPADPAVRMKPVRQDREETGREMIFRATDGVAGQAPMERIDRERQYVARAVADRTGPSRSSSIPRGSGSPLSGTVRKQMEPKLGADLSDVRVHTEGDSAQTAKDLGARAFTVGSDVHFNSGEYSPGTKEGDRLLAHELTHVVQGQKTGVQRKADPGEEAKGAEVSQPGEPAEQEADAVGDHVADTLHGESKDGSVAEGPNSAGDNNEKAKTEEKAPQIGAKLDGVGLKIYPARPERDPTTPRDDKRGIPPSVSTQSGIEILIQSGALDHILKGHTVENFDPVARLPEVSAGNPTTLFPPGFATNAQEIVTVVKQALGNKKKAAREFDPATKRQLRVTVKKVDLEVWVGAVGKSNPGAYMLNSVYPKGGVELTAAEVIRYAKEVQNKTKTLQQVRAELLGRFK